MAGSKLLYVFVFAVVVLAVYFLVAVGLNQNAGAVANEGFQKFKSSALCTLNTLEGTCAPRVTDSSGNNCLRDENGDSLYDCTLCVTETEGSSVYKCNLAVCGCPFGWRSAIANVEVVLSQFSYKPGDTLVASGKVTSTAIKDLTDAEIKFSFLGSDKKPTNKLGSGGMVEKSDQNGKYEWRYKLPQNSEAGDYFVLVEFEKGRSIEGFKVTK